MARLKPDDRKKLILEAAVNLAQLEGYDRITRDGVARVASVSPGLVTRYYYCTDELRRAVMEEAVRLSILPIIALGLVLRHPVALAAPVELRNAAVANI